MLSRVIKTVRITGTKIVVERTSKEHRHHSQYRHDVYFSYTASSFQLASPNLANPPTRAFCNVVLTLGSHQKMNYYH